MNKIPIVQKRYVLFSVDTLCFYTVFLYGQLFLFYWMRYMCCILLGILGRKGRGLSVLFWMIRMSLFTIIIAHISNLYWNKMTLEKTKYIVQTNTETAHMNTRQLFCQVHLSSPFWIYYISSLYFLENTIARRNLQLSR